jgi:pyruvate dehydrogenase E1 component alpha subunit
MSLETHERIEGLRRMLRIRRFEEAVAKAVRAGEIPGACHSSIGQEAAIVGACLALAETDCITGTHRSHGHPIGKGAALAPLMAELMGKASGICGGRGGSMHLADASVGIIGESAIVGGGIPIATGAALSAQVLGEARVSLCFFGDGAANQGTFHESLNMAAVWKLPAVYVCENNRYAATTPLAMSHGVERIALRAAAYGMPGETVDGQDLEAVHAAVARAVARARAGEGPSLVEAETYRYDEHAVNLFIPAKYRSDEELAAWRARDPVEIYRARLRDAGVLDEAALGALDEEVKAELKSALAFARAAEEPALARVFDHLYSMPLGAVPELR